MSKNKKAAMEMSVGTIVTIVLLMSVLILGIFLIQKIFGSAKSAIDMTDKQLKNEIKKLFSDQEKLIIYPETRFLEIKHEEKDAIGLGIQNLATTGSGTNNFSYIVQDTGSGNCPESVNAEDWIVVGKEDSDIPIPVGEIYSSRIIFQIPIGTPLCTSRFRVDTTIDGASYKSTSFDISVKG